MSKSSAKLMTEGSIWKRIVAFAIPLFWGNLFQQLYNTADSLIVGNFLGSSALAAVSSSGNLIFLMVGLFNGIAIGSGVIVAKYYGARDIPNLQKSIHTTVGFGLICGVTLPLSVSLPHHRSWYLWEHRRRYFQTQLLISGSTLPAHLPLSCTTSLSAFCSPSVTVPIL